MNNINFSQIKKDFPMLSKNKIVYLDSAALVQKHKNVIKATNDFYTKYSISNRTSDSEIGIMIEQRIEQTKVEISKLINCKKEEIIFNSGATEGLNYIAQLLKDLLLENDEILISKYNHSSHIIPWIEISKLTGSKIIFSDNLLKDINKKTKIIAFTQLNNTFQLIEEDVKKIYYLAKKYNSLIINDAAQAISHEIVDSKYFDAIAFSSNKLFGPTGLGVLYVREKLLNKLNVKKYGGGAIESINKNGKWKAKQTIAKHEPGTLNLAAIYAFYEALKFYNSIDKSEMKKYITELSEYTIIKLSKLKNIKVLSKPGGNIIMLEVKNISAQDLSSYLGHKNIYVRGGWFCAQYLKNFLSGPMIRISLHIYNNKKDINKLFNALSNLEKGDDFLDFI